MLASVLLYLRYAEYAPVTGQSAGERKRKRPSKVVLATQPSVAWLIASAVVGLAAMLVKETAIVLPVMIFALSLLVQNGKSSIAGIDNRESIFRSRLLRAFRETLPFLGVTVLYLLLRRHALGHLGANTQHLPWNTVLLSWPATLWFYVKVLIWPVRLRAFADSSQTETLSLTGVLLPALAVCGAVIVLAWGLRWTWKKAQRDLSARDMSGVECALLLGTLLLVLPILLTLNLNALNPEDFLHGRYTYLPLAGLMLC